MFANKNKRGISILVSYVLLVVLTVALATSTYFFLRNYADQPLPDEGCPEGTNLVIENYQCSESVLSLTLKNRGLFSVAGAFIKVGNESDSDFLYDFMIVDPTCWGINSSNIEGDCRKCGITGEDFCFEPNKERSFEKDYSGFAPIRKIMVIPYRIEDGQNVLCEDAIVVLDIAEGECD